MRESWTFHLILQVLIISVPLVFSHRYSDILYFHLTYNDITLGFLAKNRAGHGMLVGELDPKQEGENGVY